MRTKSNLDNARRNKNDEYYTYYEDVVKGLEPYKEYLKGKRVLCPCDTEQSNFVKYLKELGCDVITYHKENGEEWFKPLDYDVCVTNPPFSKIKDLFIDFIEHRLNIGKSFQNMYFNAQGEHKSVSLVMFVSNLDIVEKNPHLQLNDGIVNEYIDGTNILNVNKTKDIPSGYAGLIAVPISYICKHNTDDFDIRGIIKHGKDHKYDICRPFVNGVEKYTRLVIRRNLRG